MIDRETINRTIINILDVHQYYKYDIFNNQNLYQQIYEFTSKIVDKKGLDEMKHILDNNKKTIELIENNKEIDMIDYNIFMENLREFRKKYIILK